MTEPLICARELSVTFPVGRTCLGKNSHVVQAVNGVSLDVARGTTLGLVGESGCGKSTLGRAILRLIEPTSGHISFDGIDVRSVSRRNLRALRRHMQMIFQDPVGSLNPRMKVGDVIGEPLAIHGVGPRRQRRQRVAELLERVGLSASQADRYPHEFSGGQRQRIGLARAIGLQPKFIVCDEPVSALDVSVQAQILNLLSDLKRELGLTLLFIAHNLAVVRLFSDRVAVMYLGKIVEEASTDDLFARPRHPYTMALLAAVPEPDPTKRHAESAVLRGDPPNPMAPPQGCGFHPRCAFATDRCRHESPSLREPTSATSGHRVACHHAETIPLWTAAASVSKP